MGIVYLLTNSAFDNYVKIGKTTNLEQRLRSLDNTSVPLPFRCEYAIQVEDEGKVELLLHRAFADNRTRTTREFFEIDPQRVIAAMKLTQGIDVTPRGDIAEDDEGVKALEKAARKKRKSYSFFDAGLKIGDILKFSRDEMITATIVSSKKILFENTETSLSAAALSILRREGYTWSSVNGWHYWMFEEETVSERLTRIEEEQFSD